MDSLTASALGFLDRCDHRPTLASLISDFSRTVDDFGFIYFTMTRLPTPIQNLSSYLLANQWLAHWIDRYLGEDYIRHDIIPVYAFSQVRPFTWEEARKYSARPPLDIVLAAELAEIGAKDGFAVVMRDTDSAQAALTLGSPDIVNLSPQHRRMLHMVCLQAQIRAIELREREHRRFTQLTDREREVLRWLSTGRSAGQIARTMDVGKATVDSISRSACTKLGASDIVHALILAMRNRQIFT